jgi:hypothetical protein
MLRFKKQNRKPAQRLPLKELQQLQRENDRRLSRCAQYQMAQHYYDVYQELLSENDAAGIFELTYNFLFFS